MKHKVLKLNHFPLSWVVAELMRLGYEEKVVLDTLSESSSLTWGVSTHTIVTKATVMDVLHDIVSKTDLQNLREELKSADWIDLET
jgi:hypothetical protein